MRIYIHLPFCLSHCIYCDFYVELKATDDRRRTYLDALKTEIRHHLGGRENAPIETLYLGGGTPGLFTATEIDEVFGTLNTFAPMAKDAEITLEANPEGMADAPEAYRAIGINRLSVGVQSLHPNELKRLSRVHSRDQVYRFIESGQQAGFDNVSIDLMYGIPEQTMATWQDTLKQTLSLGIQHISMYGLKVEEDTALARLIDQGRMSVPVDEDTVDMYFEALNVLESQGFRRYEISNLAQAGRESWHNLGYWTNLPFWGFGVSAHGYMDDIRYENPRNLQAYLANPTRWTASHRSDETEQLENAFIFGLRLRDGIDIPTLEAQYQFSFDERFGPTLQKYHESGLLILENNRLKLSTDAIPVSNEILACFLQPA